MEENDKLDFDEGCIVPCMARRSVVGTRSKANPLLSNKGNTFEGLSNMTHQYQFPQSKYFLFISRQIKLDQAENSSLLV